MVNQKDAHNESLRLELQETITTIRHWFSLLIQVTGFIIAADAVLVSYGFAQRVAGILLLASLLPVIIFFVYLIIVGTMLGPLVGLLLRIEEQLVIGEDLLGMTLVRTILRLSGANFGNNESPHGEGAHEPVTGNPKWRWLWKPIPVILYVATVIQVILFILAQGFFHYRIM